MKRRSWIIGWLICCGMLFGCAPVSEPLREQVYTYSKFAVDVEVWMETTDSTSHLTATFTPSDPTLHLYGLDLPLEGIEGVGRPTRLELLAGGGAGELSADVATTDHTFPSFEEPFPLYPDGPVTLTLPVTLDADATALDLSLTYMACSSDGGCMPPVTDHRFTVALPTP